VGVTEEADHHMSYELDVCDLFEEEGDAINKIEIAQIIHAITSAGSFDTVLLKDWAKDKRKQTKMGRPIFTQSRRQLSLSCLGVLVPRLGQESFTGFTVEGSTVEAYLLLLAFNFNVECNLDLLCFPRSKVRIQGHLILATRDITEIPLKRVVHKCAMKIGHDCYRNTSENA
jgi:hypothetical protein